MSTQRGNTNRQRSQKHQNVNSFKNTLHDTSRRTKLINSTQVDGCCNRCKEIIEWKIKYKKYKPLTVAKKCVKCSQKTVKKAYCIVCQPCATKHDICVKCAKNEETVMPFEKNDQEKVKNQAQLEQELKYLPERKRRTFLRNIASGKYDEDEGKLGADGGLDDGDDDDDDTDCDTDSAGDSDDNEHTDKLVHADITCTLHDLKHVSVTGLEGPDTLQGNGITDIKDVMNEKDSNAEKHIFVEES